MLAADLEEQPKSYNENAKDKCEDKFENIDWTGNQVERAQQPDYSGGEL